MEVTNPSPVAAVKTPEAAETEIPTHVQPTKPPPFSTGVLKRHAPLSHHQHTAAPVTETYKECLRNYAASLGSHAVDGCREFMPSLTATYSDPASLKCVACGCHRNFHRRGVEEPPLPLLPPRQAVAIDYQPHHRHLPPPPKRRNSDSPPSPISYSCYYPSGPHMLMALSNGLPENKMAVCATADSKKRFRTKFTEDQKDKMLEFSNKIEWKMQKKDENMIADFCTEIGVSKDVFKVWMHNHKNACVSGNNGTIGKAQSTTTTSAVVPNHHNDGENDQNGEDMDQRHLKENSGSSGQDLGTNGSSSSG